MATKPPAPSSDHDETVILKAPAVGTQPDPFDSDKTVVRRTPAAEPFTPKPKGFSMSFDHPEANDLEATVKAAPLRDMPGITGLADPLAKRKPGASMAAAPAAMPASEAAPAKGGILKWILGGAAAIVVIILGVAYLLGSNELAAPKVTILKQGTLIEPASTSASPAPAVPSVPAAPAVAPEPPIAPPAPPAAQSTAPALAVAPAAAPSPPPAATIAATIAATTPAAPKAPPDAKALAAAAAKKAALEKERLAKQAQPSAPVVTQAPPPPVQAAPAPAPAPAAAPKAEAPPAPVAPPPPAAPSNPNQVCEGRLLFALQNCLTEQCAKPAFSKHGVCVERRAFEQKRQEEQQSR